MKAKNEADVFEGGMTFEHGVRLYRFLGTSLDVHNDCHPKTSERVERTGTAGAFGVHRNNSKNPARR